MHIFIGYMICFDLPSFLPSHKGPGLSLPYIFVQYYLMKIYHLCPLHSSLPKPMRSGTFSSASPFPVVPEAEPTGSSH